MSDIILFVPSIDMAMEEDPCDILGTPISN